jgi:hypothetical protein
MPDSEGVTVRGVIKDFNQLAGTQLNVLSVPVLNGRRTDNTDKIAVEARALGPTETVTVNGTSYEVETTSNPAPHTPINVEKEVFIRTFNEVFHNADSQYLAAIQEFFKDYPSTLPLHLINWWLTTPNQEAAVGSHTPVVFPQLTTDQKAVEQLLKVIGKNTALSVEVLDRLLRQIHPETEQLPIDQRIRIYAVFGHTPKCDRQTSGLSRGPQSHPEGHLHVVALPEAILQHHALPQEVTPQTLLKQMSPFDSVFFSCAKSTIVRKLKEKGVGAHEVSVHEKDQDSGRVTYFDGYQIDFDSPQNFEHSMQIVTEIINEAEPVYQSLRMQYQKYYNHLADEQAKAAVTTESVALLTHAGFTHAEAEKIVRTTFKLKPTYSQVKAWVNEQDNGPNKDALNKLLGKYEKRRRLIQFLQDDTKTTKPDNTSKQKVINRIMQAYELNEQEVQLYLLLLDEQLKDTLAGERATLTMPGKLSGGYSLSYSLVNGQLQISGITIATRFSEKNIYEDLVGEALTREELLLDILQ